MKYWIFDWSGTLVDDMALVLCATNHVFRTYGSEEMDREAFRRSFQLPYVKFYDEHLPKVGLEEIEAHFREGFAISEKKVEVLPHAREFLNQLKARGDRMFVLTSMCAKAFAEQVVELGMDHYFEETYAGVLDKREVIGELLENHALNKEDTVFVGDMTHDVETAHHAGIHSIGVLTGYNHSELLASSSPSIMVKDLDVLAKNMRFSNAKTTSEAVNIKGLEVPTFIGVPDEERAEQQVLKVNVSMTPKAGFASLNDEIEGGVDYYQVSVRLKEVALEKPRKLVETLAEDFANTILTEFPVSNVSLEIEKFILPDTTHVGVSLTKEG